MQKTPRNPGIIGPSEAARIACRANRIERDSTGINSSDRGICSYLAFPFHSLFIKELFYFAQHTCIAILSIQAFYFTQRRRISDE